jgi:hypothetical protein
MIECGGLRSRSRARSVVRSRLPNRTCLVVHGSLGGIMMGIAVLGGFACSLLVLATARDR